MNKSIPIFLCFDENFAPLSAVTIHSIIVTTNHNIEFYIVGQNLRAGTKKKLKSLSVGKDNIKIEIIDFNATKIFANINKPSREFIKSLSAYSRLMIPWIKPNIDKAIYIDGDTIVTHDIAELFNQKLNKKPIGAVLCREIIGTDKYEKIYSGTKLSPTHEYFQSGVLLIDCDAWRQDKKLPQAFFDIDAKYPNRVCLDQCILNKYFENNYEQLPQKYNVTTMRPECSTGTCIVKDAAIYHFIGPSKPYYSYNADAFFLSEYAYDAWWNFAKETPFYNQFINKQKGAEMATKIFEKKRMPNGRRHIYIFGKKVFSYKILSRRKNAPVDFITQCINELNASGYAVMRDKNGVTVKGNGLNVFGTADNTIWTARGVLCDKDYDFDNNGDKYIVIDVGLNIGLASLYLAQKDFVKNVYGFEPFLPTFKIAQKNMKLNPRLTRKIKLFDVGLSDKNKTINVPYNPELPGAMSSIVGRNAPSELVEKIKLVSASKTLAPIYKKHGGDKIMLKIDCEGGEREIIPDMLQSGLLQKTDKIIMEYHDDYYLPLVKDLENAGFIVGVTPHEGQTTGMITGVK